MSRADLEKLALIDDSTVALALCPKLANKG